MVENVCEISPKIAYKKVFELYLHIFTTVFVNVCKNFTIFDHFYYFLLFLETFANRHFPNCNFQQTVKNGFCHNAFNYFNLSKLVKGIVRNPALRTN